MIFETLYISATCLSAFIPRPFRSHFLLSSSEASHFAILIAAFAFSSLDPLDKDDWSTCIRKLYVSEKESIADVASTQIVTCENIIKDNVSVLSDCLFLSCVDLSRMSA